MEDKNNELLEEIEDKNNGLGDLEEPEFREEAIPKIKIYNTTELLNFTFYKVIYQDIESPRIEEDEQDFG